MDYNFRFEELSKMLDLGQIIGVPKAVSGGYLHRVFCIETDRGKFAVKALNPEIMQRPTAVMNYIRSEQISNIAAITVTALPAIKHNDNSLHKIDNQFYLVFNWVNGISLKLGDIELNHCYKMAVILAAIHGIDYTCLIDSSEDADHSERIVDWNNYLKEGQRRKVAWADNLKEVIEKLYDWASRANQATKILQSSKVISHGDLDSKNVLWSGDDTVVIDWESAGLRNPQQDLLETALYWSSSKHGNIDQYKFKTFLRGYKDNSEKFRATDWKLVLDSGFLGKLDWLDYCLKRSLGIESTNVQDQEMGTSQVASTIADIKRYEENSYIIIAILNEMLP
jgi:Ser/Thr protein kinase RdoA (MazF antagonist)